MRLVALLGLIVLTACGQNTSTPDASASAETTALTADAATLEGPIIAFGADPAWRLDARSDIGIVLVMINDDVTYSGPYSPPQRTATGYQLNGGDVVLDLETAPCVLDGVAYPMRATAQARAQEAVSGCAVVRWDGHLLALMPRIDACIAASPQTRWVTYASDTLVRMQGESGAVDCQVSAAGARIAPRDETVRVAGENAAIFVRGPGDQPGGECYDAAEVRADDGSLLGWMADPEGC